MSERPTDLLSGLLADLDAETAALRSVVAGLDGSGWRTPTPAEGWSVGDQVGHLAWTDAAAVVAATDKDAWDTLVLRALADPVGFVDAEAHTLAALPSQALLSRWDRVHADLATALAALPAGTTMPWFGPPMSAASMATARLMETWAHGLDVREALGVAPEPTDRIRHVAHLGVRTRDFSYAVHELSPPSEPFRVELLAPSGATWVLGEPEAAQSVRGTAYDFCLLVTQRVHRDDTTLEASGADAEQWLAIAQCFAGRPGGGRERRGG